MLGRLQHWLSENFLWTTLRSIGNSTAAKLTILIPAIGYLIIFNEYLLPYIGLSHQLFGVSDVPPAEPASVSLRLLLLYFALCLIAVGSILYGYFCPYEVKTHGSAADYITRERESTSELQFEKIESRLRTSDASAYRVYRDRFDPLISGASSREGELFERSRANSYVMDLNFRNLDRRSFPARLATSTFYMVGFLVLFMLSLQVFWRVCSALIQRVA